MRKIFVVISWLLFIISSSCTAEKTPVILVAIDAFRWDYPEKAETPNIDWLVENGVRAQSLIPSFPTKTFPNFYTIATGLYPGNHGIVANNMYNPVTGKHFKLSIREEVRNPEWWRGEPIWVTCEKQGVKTASYFWPGSETKIKGILPSYWHTYDGDIPDVTRIQAVLEWLDLPEADRPYFMTTYFSAVDEVGHNFSPDSDEVAEQIAYVDRLIGKLLAGLRDRDLLHKVNIILVSDHGMAEVDSSDTIFLDDYINLSDVQVVDWNPVAAINPRRISIEDLYLKLIEAHPHLHVYKKADLPDRFHYSNTSYIPEIIAIADEGWRISSRPFFAKLNLNKKSGNHGFDPNLQSMGATFIAQGPAFKKNFKGQAFGNIHLYEMFTSILDVKPAANDGSLDSVRVYLNIQ